MEGILFQTSLIAAFVAGMVALFAPCCITFLLPAYLGSVFKEKEKVLFMTIVFGLGIFVTLMPAVLGVAFLSKLLFRYHNDIYIVSALVMLAVAGISLLGIKLPMPKIPGANMGGKTDIFSIFTLGIFSGITSACCAPVLIGILSLTFLSPGFFGALSLGGMYVLGMITPLFIISIFLTDKMPQFTALRRPLAIWKVFGKEYPVILSNLIAAAIFSVTGLLTLILTLTGKLSMEKMSGVTRSIQSVAGSLNSIFGDNIFLNIGFVLILALGLYYISKKV